MATDKTRLTELATAVGLVYEPARNDPLSLDHIEVPGLDAAIWQPAVLPATHVGSPHRVLLLRALDNGRTFRRVVLGGRRPERVEWVGGARAVWTSDIPRDLTVDGVWFIQAKYDSSCVLNTSPGSLVDDLLSEKTSDSRNSWFVEVALDQLQGYYDAFRAELGDEAPTDVRDLDKGSKGALRSMLRAAPASRDQESAYEALCRVVSLETTLRWRHRLDTSSLPQRTQMLFRMLRIAGGPYWLLGARSHEPVRLRVMDTQAWRQRFELRRFDVVDAHAGQPQVDWRAEIRERPSGDRRVVEGCCEIRWSHGKLQGNPECKVQVSTPLESVPGYEPMG